ncbi:MAG TPA: hypothetical protein VFH68_00865 [Polyangia bacterium]|jgi:hypothetical protein|nr:hypothetical protein [Polyangia bacterium]
MSLSPSIHHLGTTKQDEQAQPASNTSSTTTKHDKIDRPKKLDLLDGGILDPSFL